MRAGRTDSLLIALVMAWPLAAGGVQTAPRQVDIRARFVEINTSQAKALGISWSVGKPSGAALNLKAFSPEEFAKALPGAVPAPTGAEPIRLSRILSVLQDQGEAAVLGRPEVTLAGGREATITARKDVSIPGPAGGTVEKDFGLDVNLVFNPIVTSDGRVTLQVETKSASDALVFGPASPIRTPRKATAAATLSEGQTLVIGGLLDDNFRTAASKVPALAGLPLIGSLFRSEKYRSGTSELFLFVTPRVRSEEGGSGGASGRGTGYAFSVAPLFTFGGIGTSQDTTFGGESEGQSIPYSTGGLSADFRYSLGPKDLSPKIRIRPFIGLRGTLNFGAGSEGLEGDDHPPRNGQPDTFLTYDLNGTLTPYVGLKLAHWRWGGLNLSIGPRLSFSKLVATTDESGGGGRLEEFSQSRLQLGLAAGIGLDAKFPKIDLGGLKGGLRASIWAEFLPGAEVTGRSSTYPFDYAFKANGALLTSIELGFYLRFGDSKKGRAPIIQ